MPRALIPKPYTFNPEPQTLHPGSARAGSSGLDGSWRGVRHAAPGAGAPHHPYTVRNTYPEP
jgi:hypothetical protein